MLLSWLASLFFAVLGLVSAAPLLCLGAFFHKALTGLQTLSPGEWALLIFLGLLGMLLDDRALALVPARPGAPFGLSLGNRARLRLHLGLGLWLLTKFL